MSIKLLAWTSRPDRPSPSEVVASMHATVRGRPWRRAGGLPYAGVEVLLTTHEIVISSRSGLHIQASLDDLTDISSFLGVLEIKASDGKLTFEAPVARLAPFVEKLRSGRLTGASTEQRGALPEPRLPASGTTRPQDGSPPLPHARLSGGLADNLLVLAMATPRLPWAMRLQLALTAACFIELFSEERLGLDGDGSLVVLDEAPTGRPAHDLVVRRIAGSGTELYPSTWVFRLAAEVSWALLDDAQSRSVASGRAVRIAGLWTRLRYQITDEAHVADLREELRRVYDGSSTEPMATALLALCAHAGLRELIPGRPKLTALRRRARQLHPSVVAVGFGDAPAVLLMPPDGSMALLWPDFGPVDAGGAFEL